MYLLDTDHLGILQRRMQPETSRLLDRMARHSPSDFYVSIISFHEQMAGWYDYLNRATNPTAVVLAYRMFERVLVDLSALQVLPFDDAAASVFQSLRQQRVRVGTMDLRISAVAIARGLTLLSRNLVDFQKVPGLKVEDWTIA